MFWRYTYSSPPGSHGSLCIPAAVILCLLLTACGSDQPKIDAAFYADWETYNSEKFNIYFAPQSTWLERKAELGNGYDRFLIEICNLLEMPVPEGKIELYIYSPNPRLMEIIEENLPFSTDKAIHWGGMYPYGYQLTKFLLARKGIKPGRFTVLNEGVPHLLDFSGLNYHDKTNRLVNSGKSAGLLDLGDKTTFDALDFAARRAQSASLSGFIMYNYGLSRLFMLWKSSVDWKQSIETIFQLPIDEFEKNWFDFARKQSSDPEGTVENDPMDDMRILQQ